MLRKTFKRDYIPGTPEVPASAGGYFCYSQPGAGYWEMQCSQVDIPIGASMPLPPGTAVFVTRDAQGNIVKITANICVSVWVSTGPAGPPTCTNIPATEYRPAVPGHFASIPKVGWDSGANSVTARAGDCEARWTMGLVVGVYIGFTDDLAQVDDIARYSHAMYFHQHNGRPLFRLVENGIARSGDREYALDAEFRIRRYGELVTYWMGETLLYTSSQPSTGEINVGSSLYVSGDGVA